MKTLLRAPVLTLGAVLALAACQRPVDVLTNPSGPSPSASGAVIVATSDAVPAGTELRATLDQTVGTAASKLNDPFTMTLQTPVQNAAGQVIVPQGAKITGRVTALRESTDVATPAVIRLEIQRIEWGGRTHPMMADITQAKPRTSGRTTEDVLRGAATGAAAGAVLGAIIGRDIQGALTGAAIGAGAGTVISLGTANQQAALEAGSEVTLRLTQPLSAR
ncbi:MAG TPA: YMGG-like glycine zipper-containing protein [Longimicrobiaceae bacterium]|jgi:hypothetical protein|nr:YMGG-like glycine zipper-containing protein [Longimicrobiaceae bacterium]